MSHLTPSSSLGLACWLCHPFTLWHINIQSSLRIRGGVSVAWHGTARNRRLQLACWESMSPSPGLNARRVPRTYFRPVTGLHFANCRSCVWAENNNHLFSHIYSHTCREALDNSVLFNHLNPLWSPMAISRRSVILFLIIIWVHNLSIKCELAVGGWDYGNPGFSLMSWQQKISKNLHWGLSKYDRKSRRTRGAESFQYAPFPEGGGACAAIKGLHSGLPRAMEECMLANRHQRTWHPLKQNITPPATDGTPLFTHSLAPRLCFTLRFIWQDECLKLHSLKSSQEKLDLDRFSHALKYRNHVVK